MSKRISIIVLGALLVANVVMWAPAVRARRANEFTQVELMVDAYHEIVSDFVEEPDQEKITEAAVRAMLDSLDDPHSMYFNPEEVKGFNKQVQGSFSGIGAEVDIHNDRLRIVSPLEDSPAWRSGVIAGDIVLEVDGRDTKGLKINDCIKFLTGPAGTDVTIKVRHRSGDEEVIKITRARIKVQTVRGWRRRADNQWDHMIDTENKIGYIRLTQFTGTTADKLFEVMDNLEKEGVKGLILDMRFNPGGLLDSAAKICNRFLDKGQRIVSTRGRNVPERVLNADGQKIFPKDIPVAILVNGSSASASEIVSGALQDNGRGKVFGTRTFGKGSVQQVKRLESGQGAIKLTSAYYYLPSGRNIQRKGKAKSWGVDPEDGFQVPMTPEQITEMVKVRRESTGPENKLNEVTRADAEWVENDLKDIQLAAAMRSMLGKLKDGKWTKVGKSGADEIAADATRANLIRQRDFLKEGLAKVEKELASLDKPKEKDAEEKTGPEARVPEVEKKSEVPAEKE